MGTDNNKDNNSLEIFEGYSVRKHYDEKKEKWYFSVVDIVAVLTEQKDYQRARSYWSTLKSRLNKEGSAQTVTNCDRSRMVSRDGRMRITDIADLQTIFRIIQSIPSKKAEPFKRWLARVGEERIQEIANPGLSVNRARENWKQQGRNKKWIEERMMGKEIRGQLTDVWKKGGVEGKEFAMLTDVIHKEWSGLTTKDHKNLKGLKTQNLRDHMSIEELLFTSLAEFSTKNIAESKNAQGYKENADAGRQGGGIAKNARKELEEKTGKDVVTGENFLPESDVRNID